MIPIVKMIAEISSENKQCAIPDSVMIHCAMLAARLFFVVVSYTPRYVMAIGLRGVQFREY